MPLYARKANKIITVSEFSKSDISKRYKINPAKIDVAHNGASEIYKPLAEGEKLNVRAEHTQGHNYFLFVGAIHPRKNLSNLLLAFDALKKETGAQIKLVIAGRKAWKAEDVKNVYESMSFKDDVVFTG